MKPPVNLFIVGAAKAGTTTLWEYLRGHHDIFFPASDKNKEPAYFSSKVYKPSWEEYVSLYSSSVANEAKYRGDASTYYLTDPMSARLISEYIRNAKIIIILRNPVDRAYSLYNWMVQNGYEYAGTFERALSLERRRAKKSIPNFLEPSAYYHYMYFSSGLYDEQINRYFECFQRDAVRVKFFEELQSDPGFFLKDICEFLEIAPIPTTAIKSNPSQRVISPKLQFALRKIINIEVKFSNKVPSSIRQRDALLQMGLRKGKPHKMRRQTRARLIEAYRDSTERLSSLLSSDLSHWADPTLVN